MALLIVFSYLINGVLRDNYFRCLLLRPDTETSLSKGRWGMGWANPLTMGSYRSGYITIDSPVSWRASVSEERVTSVVSLCGCITTGQYTQTVSSN